MSPERIAEITEMARTSYSAFRALSDAERSEWHGIVSPPTTYAMTPASRREATARKRETARANKVRAALAERRDEMVRAVSSDADLAR